jgi:site-specific DNA-adenine methylase
VKDNPIDVAMKLQEWGYSRDIFDEAKEMKKQNYMGCSDLDIAAYRKVLTDQSYNAACCTYRDIDRGCDDDVNILISAKKYRERYHRQLLPDCMAFSQEIQGTNVIQGDMFDYLNRLHEPDLWCLMDPPFQPKKRSAGMKGYDEDWSEATHLKLLETLYGMYLKQQLQAKIMIFCYVDMDNMQGDLYCRYLLSMGFSLFLLKDQYLPRIFSDAVKNKGKRKKKVTECAFINYEPVAGDIVEPERMFTYEDVFGDKAALL